MSDDLSIEELIIDDSFANYCFQSNAADSLFWKEYIQANPSQKARIEEATQIVLGLHSMLKEKHDEGKSSLLKIVPPATNKMFIRKMVRYAAAIAAVFVIAIAGKKIIDQNNKQTASKDILANTAPLNILLYKTASGEKKVITLPDSSKLYLNAGSELRVDADFGRKNRTVYLTGEALFDVTHNISLPFIVHSNKYDVKVLGTLFNIKDYPGDKLSETSLIRGRVEINLKNRQEKIVLLPNQKAVIDSTGNSLRLKNEKHGDPVAEKLIVLLPISYNIKDSMVIETAWAQNRLEIVNESFADIKKKLERWFNVKITFKDTEVSKYTFSATFEKETIKEVLQLLQNAYYFKYEINEKENEIIISK